MSVFELERFGTRLGRHARARRAGIDDLGWGTLGVLDMPPLLLARARRSWTDGALSEYSTAAAFVALLDALFASAAPIDLAAAVADFVADEMVHVELNARMAMELGGAHPMEVDLDALAPELAPGLSAFERANELAVRVSSVGEAFSLPMLAGTARAASHPLSRGVLARIARDEGPHAKWGSEYLAWASERMSDAERERLGAVATDEIERLASFWRGLASVAAKHVDGESFSLDDVRALGWMEAGAYARLSRVAVEARVVAPLALHGIVPCASCVESALAEAELDVATDAVGDERAA